MDDPFVGTWTLNPARSEFDANHKPMEGRMTWQLDTGGAYLLLAEGVDAKGTVGEGTYVVANDGTTMIATTRGFDSQLRAFTMRTVWDRA